MQSFDLVIAGGQVVSADSVVEADIAVTGGVIVAVGQGLAAQGAREVIAAGRDRQPRAPPRARLHAQGGLGHRPRRGGGRRRYHRIRDAQHRSADRHARGAAPG